MKAWSLNSIFFRYKQMKLTIETIRQLIKEELDDMSNQQKLLKLISDGQWSVAMDLASSLGFLDDKGFANNVMDAVVRGLEKETAGVDVGEDNKLTIERQGMGLKIYVMNLENGMTGQESSLMIEDDGSLTLKSFAPPEMGRSMDFYTIGNKPYMEQGLSLDQALEKLNIIYSFGLEALKQ